MRKMLMLGAAAAALFTAGTANAAVTFNVTGTFSTSVNGAANAGSLSGTFTTSNDLQQLLSYSLTSTATSSGYASITYNGNNSAAIYMPNATTLANETFMKLSLSSSETLLLNFGSQLTSSGTTLVPSLFFGSSETQLRSSPTFAGTRYLTGTITAAVPEPATWAMMFLGFGLVAGATRYRRKTVTVTYA